MSVLASAIGSILLVCVGAAVTDVRPALRQGAGSQASAERPQASQLADALLAAGSREARDQLGGAAAPALLQDAIRSLAALADTRRLRGDFSGSLAAATVAVEQAERTGEVRTLVRALNVFGSAKAARSELAEALPILMRSRDLAGEAADQDGLADALSRLSSAHFQRGEAQLALDAANRSVSLRRQQGDPAQLAIALTAAGMANRVLSNFDAAVTSYEEAIALARQAGAENQLARALNNLAVAERERGNNERAIDLYNQSLAIHERLGNRALAANTLSNLGLSAQDLGQNEVALDYYLRGLRILEEAGDRRTAANTLGSIGFLYRAQGNDALAQDYYRRALEISEAIGNKDNIARMVSFLGRIHLSRSEYAQAEPLFTRAMALRREIGDRAGVANVLLDFGRLAEARGDYASAAQRYREGLAIFNDIGERRSLSFALLRLATALNRRAEHKEALQHALRALDTAHETGQDARVWATHLAIGRAWRGLGDLQRAAASLDESIAAVEAMREQAAGGDEDRQRAFERQIDPYREMVDLLVVRGDLHAALAYAERMKARILVEVLHHGRVNITKAMTSAEAQEEAALDAAVLRAATQMQRERQRGKPDQERMREAQRQLDAARVAADALRLALYAKYPALKAHRSEVAPVGAADLRTLVRDTAAALVEFVVGRDSTIVFVVTRGKNAADDVQLTAHRIPRGGAALETSVEDYRTALGRRDLGFRTMARALYDDLLAPIASRLAGHSRLLIVPEGPLWGLPFHALAAPDGRFTIEKYAVAYAPSLTSLREMRRSPAPRREPSVLAFGDPRFGEAVEPAGPATRAADLQPLPSAAQEVRAIGRLYAGAQAVHVGTDATEARWKATSPQYTILHLATHGILNDAEPMSSHLLLAPSRDTGDPPEDGRLQAREILRLDLSAQLAVLSGCETARGRVGAGEGVIGLTWALFVAGVPTTVVSQWRVDSESTSKLMVGMHRLLARPNAPMSPADALRETARGLLATPSFRHPFYWAGFVAIGDGFGPVAQRD